ncbi:hypothetical protein [Terrisporobacter sp.]|uniref:hypothetical protein n=1 Tax=Terrisporobacter sp. TaxID=1965305 RepID=UPI0028A273D6|nr:hypothetical protein [Terrisporobacter sp.]
MGTQKSKLINCFIKALEEKKKFVAVEIETKDSKEKEIIINPYKNINAKLNYYQNAYDDNLVLKSFNGIKINNFTSANSLGAIERKLISKEK